MDPLPVIEVVVGGPDLRRALVVAADRSDFVAVVGPGDVIADGALARVQAVLDACRAVDVLYGDETREIDGFVVPFYKPAWSPARLRGQHYLSGVAVYRSDLLKQVEGQFTDSADAALHELALLVTEVADPDRILHIPEILCQVDGQGLGPSVGGVAVVQNHFDRIGFPATAIVDSGGHTYGYEPEFLEVPPLVSLIVPTGGTERQIHGRQLKLVDNAITSVLERSTYPNFEIVVVVDQRSTQALADRILGLGPTSGRGAIRVVKDERPFNFAAAANLGVEASRAEGDDVVVLLNDDTEVVTPDWMERFVAMTRLDSVGAVGAKLLYSDGRIQHAGILGRRGESGHTCHGYPGDETGHWYALDMAVNAIASTGACLAIRRDHWDAVDGMDEQFPLNYNDVDLCLRLRDRGWEIVVDHSTVLTHHETSSRPMGSEGWEDTLFSERWSETLVSDPYDSPNFVAIGMEQVPKPVELVHLREIAGLAARVAR